MRNWPPPSVTTDRTFSMRAGLAASTVTPGSTAPDVSRTTPVIDACANATAGARHTARTNRHPRRTTRFIVAPFTYRSLTAWMGTIGPLGRWKRARDERPPILRAEEIPQIGEKDQCALCMSQADYSTSRGLERQPLRRSRLDRFVDEPDQRRQRFEGPQQLGVEVVARRELGWELAEPQELL